VLFHVSEEPAVAEFSPRPSQYTQDPVVWAVHDDKIRNYLLPRDCPRVTCYADAPPFQRSPSGFSERARRLLPLKPVGGIAFALSLCSVTTCRRTHVSASAIYAIRDGSYRRYALAAMHATLTGSARHLGPTRKRFRRATILWAKSQRLHGTCARVKRTARPAFQNGA
jgi:hypothetical protein